MKQKMKETKNSDIRETVADLNEDALFMDGPEYDSAVIGICYQFGRPPVVAYDKSKVLKILMKNSDMNLEAANEFWEYNQLGSGMGENTPVFIDKLFSP